MICYYNISNFLCNFAVSNKSGIDMTRTIGTYFFGRHRGNWGIWQIESISNGVTMSDHVKDVYSYEDAVRETYRLNGWDTPKRIYKKF